MKFPLASEEPKGLPSELIKRLLTSPKGARISATAVVGGPSGPVMVLVVLNREDEIICHYELNNMDDVLRIASGLVRDGRRIFSGEFEAPGDGKT